jgi:DNA-binding transcriptional regulator YiaG
VTDLSAIKTLGDRRKEAVAAVDQVEEELKQAIRAARAADKSLTVRQLASLAGVSHQTIVNWSTTQPTSAAS